MTESMIKKVLQEATNPSGALTVITRQLTAAVHWAKVWPPIAAGSTVLQNPYTLYLLTDTGKGYVAAVEDMDSSLLFYNTKGYKSADFIVDALMTAILPHIFQRKAIQRLSLSQTELGQRSYDFHLEIAKAAGFKVVREEPGVCYLVLEATALKNRPYVAGVNSGIAKSRVVEIKSELLSVAEILFRLQVEMEMKNGVTYQSEILGDIIKEVKNYEGLLSTA